MAAPPSGPPGWRFASTPTTDPAPPRQPRLPDRLRHARRVRHLSPRTEDAIARQYPAAGAAGGRRWGFPSAQLSVDPRTGVCRRHHAHPSAVNRATVAAAKAAGVAQRATARCFRHAFATRLRGGGQAIRAVRGRSGHAGVAATMIDTHALNHGGSGVRSPAARRPGGAGAGGA